MANLKILKSFEQVIDKKFFTPTRNIMNFNMICNSTVEKQYPDSDSDYWYDERLEYYGVAGYGQAGYAILGRVFS